eukprot:2676190-Amphidinium_carterae.2
MAMQFVNYDTPGGRRRLLWGLSQGDYRGVNAIGTVHRCHDIACVLTLMLLGAVAEAKEIGFDFDFYELEAEAFKPPPALPEPIDITPQRMKMESTIPAPTRAAMDDDSGCELGAATLSLSAALVVLLSLICAKFDTMVTLSREMVEALCPPLLVVREAFASVAFRQHCLTVNARGCDTVTLTVGCPLTSSGDMYGRSHRRHLRHRLARAA